MLALNALSFALAWIVQNRALNSAGMLMVGGFALANAVLGTWLLWRLLAAPLNHAPPNDALPQKTPPS